MALGRPLRLAFKVHGRTYPGDIRWVCNGRPVSGSQVVRASRYIELYSSAVRLAASAFIQDPLTVDVVVNAPALTHQGIVIARDRLRSISFKRAPRPPKTPADGIRPG